MVYANVILRCVKSKTEVENRKVRPRRDERRPRGISADQEGQRRWFYALFQIQHVGFAFRLGLWRTG